jgi:CubicO group peptidase (beta-lactamase class C family)
MNIDFDLLQDAAAFSVANETPWDRGNTDNWGIHNLDRPPWNRLLGPVHPRGPVSGVILVAGKQVLQWGEPDRADLTFSVAKTYLALLAGVAIDKGLLVSLDEPVSVRTPGIGFDDAHNRLVTWRHLLHQTSEWQGDCFGIPDQVDRYRHLQYQPPRADEDKGENCKKGDARALRTPGTYWEYNDVRINQLALALLHLFRRPLPDVFLEHIAAPCGLSDSWRWEGYENSWVEIDGKLMQSVPGGTHWGGGVSISSHDQAKIGQMLLNEGRVGSRQVLTKDWVKLIQTPCPIAPWYGALVWLNQLNQLNQTRGVFPSASKNSYFCIGAGASMVWVDPDSALVAVVRWIAGDQIDGFCKLVMQAIQ